MKIVINRLNDAYHMEARNEEGQSVQLDGSTNIGGVNGGMRPMQLLLTSLGGCSTIDIISILTKQKQTLEDIQVEVDGERDEEQIPAVFKSIHVHFKLQGDLDEEKVQKAVSLSMDKYCSVAKMLEKTADITYDFSIN